MVFVRITRFCETYDPLADALILGRLVPFFVKKDGAVSGGY
jgi:hypothetical protein